MSAATSFYATFQQLMLSLGICVGAVALQVAHALQGHPRLRLSDFTLAFLVGHRRSRWPRRSGTCASPPTPAPNSAAMRPRSWSLRNIGSMP